MNRDLLTAIAELIELVVLIVGTLLSALFGLFLENLAIQHAISGDSVAAIWFFATGIVALYVSLYMLGYSRVLPRVNAFG